MVFAAVNGAFGLAVCGTGVYYSGKSFLQEHVVFFHESSCSEGATFWGNDLWGPALSNSSEAYTEIVVGCCGGGGTCGS